jgi:hypothetical protein
MDNKKYTIAKFSELDDNWDSERLLNKRKGLETYMIINGKWQKSLPNQSTYSRHIYATEEQIEELNNMYERQKRAQQEYKELLSKYTKDTKRYLGIGVSD